jgi:hypothetical protein
MYGITFRLPPKANFGIKSVKPELGCAHRPDIARENIAEKPDLDCTAF